MCTISMVSERWPWMNLPNFALLPPRLSEPTSRMFSDALYTGGRWLPRSGAANVTMLCSVFRYWA